mmetsp:Transcript_82442/g.145462  ORF Transcript_82442/g.145462 Transcript_82442/m.145462 type:complete len:501 (-) Transcript_82442:185-1687(-)
MASLAESQSYGYPPAPDEAPMQHDFKRYEDQRKAVTESTISLPVLGKSVDELEPLPDCDADDGDYLSDEEQDEVEECNKQAEQPEPSRKKKLNVLQLHSLHFQAEHLTESGVPQKLRLPGCTTTLGLAEAASTFKADNAPSLDFQIAVVLFAALTAHYNGTDVSLLLRGAEIGWEETNTHAVIAILPDMESELDYVSDYEVECWLFTCSCEDLADWLDFFRSQECFFRGLHKGGYVIDQETPKVGGSTSFLVHGWGRMGEKVAIKRMKTTVGKDRVLHEMKTLQASQGHPNIIGLQGLFVDNLPTKKGLVQAWNLVTDLHTRGDLYDWVIASRGLKEAESLQYMSDLCKALVHLAERNIIHRDIKPENCLLTDRMKLVLCDFGIALSASQRARESDKCGSLGYISPEVIKRETVGFHSDAFGAGVVLYFMLSRSTPFWALTQEATESRTVVGEVNLQYMCFQETSQTCRDIILGLLEVDVSKRITASKTLELIKSKGRQL